jgi:SET domain-containing protein
MSSANVLKKPEPAPALNPLIEWAYVHGKDRGIIARVDIPKGTLIERSPALVFPVEDMTRADGSSLLLENYCFLWEEKGEDIEYAIGLGYIGLYNHSKNPNAEFDCEFETKEMTMTAARDIKAGEEVTFDYDCELWFEPK